jgi:tetratricopeptide (TPR) repeat protein
LKAFEHATILNPGDSDSQYRLGTEYLKLGNVSEAVHHLNEANRLHPGDRSTLYNLQRALRKAGRLQDADAALASVAALSRKSDTAGEESLAAARLNDAGIELEKKGDIGDALEKYRQAEDLDPGHGTFLLNHGLALCRLGRWKDGIAEIKEVTEEDPNNSEAARDLYIAMDQFHSASKSGSRGESSVGSLK